MAGVAQRWCGWDWKGSDYFKGQSSLTDSPNMGIQNTTTNRKQHLHLHLPLTTTLLFDATE